MTPKSYINNYYEKKVNNYILPTSILQYVNSLYCGGNSTKSVNGFSVNINEKAVPSLFQLVVSNTTPRNILNATLDITSPVSRKFAQFDTPLLAKNSSIRRIPILYPIFSNCWFNILTSS